MFQESRRDRLILLIDDDPIFRELAAGWLRPYYRIAAFGNGNNLENRLKELRPDMLIIDAWLRGRDAFEFCRQLAGDKEWRAMPVLLVTARHGDSLYSRSISIGGVNFLSKPTSRHELTAMVDEILRGRGYSGHPAGGGSSRHGLELVKLLAFGGQAPYGGRPIRWMPMRRSRAF